MPADKAMPGLFSGLSIKLIATIITVILVVEILLYLPSIASYRANWLNDRLRVGVVAARVLDAVPDVMAIPRSLTDNLLNSAGATAIVYRRAGQSQLIELEGRSPPEEVVTADMTRDDFPALIFGAVEGLVVGGNRTLRIIGNGEDASGQTFVEILMSEAPLRRDMLIYSRNILVLSLIIAAITAIVLYLTVSRLLIGPIRRLTGNMVAFRQAPENATLILHPSRRKDEIGIAERELAAMETDLFTMLRQRQHLADLGLAVSKINHDLRNMLASAQLLSDQVVALEDPAIQRLAPRLVLTLDKAIGFAQSVLDYGRESVKPPRPGPVDLRLLLDEAAIDAGVLRHPEIVFENRVPDDMILNVDADQMARVFVNLLRNARQALEGQGPHAERPRVWVESSIEGQEVQITLRDNGPGLPPRARENLFVAFQGSARAGGTGLGLAIAKELVEAHGGRIGHVDGGKGAAFTITLPEAALLAA